MDIDFEIHHYARLLCLTAARKGNIDVVKESRKFNLSDSDIADAITIAAENGHADIVAYLRGFA